MVADEIQFIRESLYVYTNNREHIRQDIVFFINGLPLLFAETKSPALNAVEKALPQVSQYHEKSPELLTHQQIYSLPHIIKYYFYSATWKRYSGISPMTEEKTGSAEESPGECPVLTAGEFKAWVRAAARGDRGKGKGDSFAAVEAQVSQLFQSGAVNFRYRDPGAGDRGEEKDSDP